VKALKTALTVFVAVCIEWALLFAPLSSSTQPHTARNVVLVVLAVAVAVGCAIVVFRINRSRPDAHRLSSSGSHRRLN
jgi:hypothetical protein